eukprot:CAMPEP_0119409252 /NCGR_PEP_ID=MMETSP1335-20130426/2591_1 /TAXON_ID=259385 /ORGANISM="Chrysoculter rhomboideus, Strain RCC1486" /LENGTH=285 /DNA_ID=CAMNT_0007433601 /DNA_START=26 /DNA_END=883 /DNA_ORIENTATION=-
MPRTSSFAPALLSVAAPRLRAPTFCRLSLAGGGRQRHPLLIAIVVSAACLPTADAYLLVAMPKSASTSLMSTLRRVTGIAGKQERPERDVQGETRVRFAHGANASDAADDPEAYVYAAMPHLDMCSWRPQLVRMMVRSRRMLFKQHLPPTRSNMQAVLSAMDADANASLVILLRAVVDAARAYTRHAELVKHFAHYPRPSEDLAAMALGTVAPLHLFATGWEAFVERSPHDIKRRILVVRMHELIEHTSDVVERIIALYGMRRKPQQQAGSPIKLAHERFTQHSS